MRTKTQNSKKPSQKPRKSQSKRASKSTQAVRKKTALKIDAARGKPSQKKALGKVAELGAEILRLSGGKLSTSQLHGILDTLPNHIALLDPVGELLLVNEAWMRFAVENGMARRDASEGNYLEVCRQAALQGDEIATQTVRGIEDVLCGSIKVFELDYPCDSLTEQRWFRMHVRAVEFWGERCCLVSHSDITPRV